MRNNAHVSSNLAQDIAGNMPAIESAKDVKRALLLRHGSLSNAAKHLSVDYTHLSHVLSGRLHTRHILAAIRVDLGLSESKMAELFPRPMSAREYKLAQASA